MLLASLTWLPAPLALRRVRASRVVGWLGLAAFAWATVGLPAAHALQHAREAAADDAAAARAEDVHVLLRAFIHGAPGRPALAHHHHHDGAPADPTTPSTPDPSHGRGSLDHFAVALLIADPPRVPPPTSRLSYVVVAPRTEAPALAPTRATRTTRGPPAPVAS